MGNEDRTESAGDEAGRIERLLAQRREECERRAVVMRDMLLLLLVFMVACMIHSLIVRIICGAALAALAVHLVSAWREMRGDGDAAKTDG